MTDLATRTNPRAWMLAEGGKYQRALDLYDEAKLGGFKLSPPDHSNCGKFLLCLKKYEEALAQFREATELRKDKGSYLDSQGAALWLMGKYREAVAAWRYRAAGILSGKIVYTDSAGGASDGLLLWYAAVTLKDDNLLKYSIEYFHELSTFGRLSSWPGPLVDLALGVRSTKAIFQERFGSMWLGWLRRSDTLQRRELVNALFYFAVRHRVDGQEHECKKMMAQVVKIKNPLGEVEWYLARGELSQAPALPRDHHSL